MNCQVGKSSFSSVIKLSARPSQFCTRKFLGMNRSARSQCSSNMHCSLHLNSPCVFCAMRELLSFAKVFQQIKVGRYICCFADVWDLCLKCRCALIIHTRSDCTASGHLAAWPPCLHALVSTKLSVDHHGKAVTEAPNQILTVHCAALPGPNQQLVDEDLPVNMPWP